MRYIHFHHQPHRELLQERRLIFKQGGGISQNEVLGEKVDRAIELASQTTETAKAALKDLISTLKPDETTGFMQQFESAFGSLEQDEQVPIWQSLENLSQRVSGRGTEANLASMKLWVEARRGQMEELAGDGVDAAQSTFEKTTQAISKSAWNPVNWGKEEWIGAGVVAAGTFALVKFGKWLFYKKETTKTRVVEAARTGKAHIAVIAAVAVTGVAAFFGIKWMKDSMLKNAKDKLRQAEKALRDLDAQRKAMLGALATAGEQQKAALMAQLEQNRIMMEGTMSRMRDYKETLKRNNRLQMPKKKNEQGHEEDKEAEQPENPQPNPEEGAPKQELPITQDQVQEGAEVALDELGKRLIPTTIVTFMEEEVIDTITVDAQSRLLAEVIFDNTKAGVTMEQVFGAIVQQQGNEIFEIKDPIVIRGGTDKENRTAMAHLFLSFCQQHRTQVVSTIMKNEEMSEQEAIAKINAMSPEEYAEAAVGSYGSVTQMAIDIQNAQGDPLERLKALDMRKYISNDEYANNALYEFAMTEMGLSEEDMQDISPVKLLRATVDSDFFGPTVNTAGDAAQKIDEDSPVEMRVLAKIFEELKNGDTYKYLIPAFHGVYPTTEGGKTPEELVKSYLLRMRPEQALRFFLYRRMIDDAQPMGLMLMQAEVMKFIGEEDIGLLQNARKKLILQIAEKVASKSGKELAEEWAKYGITLPEEFFDIGFQGIGTITGAIAGIAATAVQQELGWVAAVVEKWPVAAGVGFVASAEFHKARIRQTFNAHEMKTTLSSKAASLHGNSLTKRSIAALRKITPGVSSSPDIIRASRNYNRLVDGIASISDATPAGVRLFDECMALLEEAVHSTHNPQAWKELAAKLKLADAYSPSDLIKYAEHAENFANNAKYRSVLHRILYAIKPAESLPGAVWNTLVKRPLHFSYRVYDWATRRALPYSVLHPVRNTGRHLLDSWRGASRFQRIGWIGTSVLGVVGTVAEHQRMKQREEEAEQNVDFAAEYLAATEEMIQREKLPDGRDKYIPLGDGDYRHAVSGVEFSVSISMKEAAENLGSVGEDRVDAQQMRRDALAIGTAANILMGPKLAMGPAGLAIFAIEVAVRGGINAWEQGKMREFIADSPAWLVAAIGTEHTTGVREYDWLAKSGSWMVSDLWEGEDDKKTIRKKTLFAMFSADLGQHAPQMLQEILGSASPEVIEEFYADDFQNIVLPAFYISLFRSARGDDIEWSRTSEGSIQETVFNEDSWIPNPEGLSNPLQDFVAIMMGEQSTNNRLVPPDATFTEIRMAMREAAVLYTQHIRETRYMEYRMFAESLEDGQYLPKELADFIESAGNETALGIKLADLKTEDYITNQKQSRTSLLLQKMMVKLNLTEGDTRQAKLEANTDLFSVNNSGIAGLEDDFDFSDSKKVLTFLGQPALVMQIEKVTGETLEDEIAEQGRRWNDYNNNLASIFTQPSFNEAAIDGIRYSAPFWVGDNIASELGEEDISPAPSVFGAFTGSRSGKGRSHNNARQYVTDATTRYFEAVPEEKRSFRRSEKIQSKLYDNQELAPAVFARGVYIDGKTWELCRYLRYPDGIGEHEGFSKADLKAVFFEGEHLKKSGHYSVLATYVFGDPKNGKVSVLQKAAGSARGTGDGIMMDTVGEGLVNAYTADQFLQKENADDMLNMASDGQADREQEVEQMRQKEQQRRKEEQQKREERERKWREEIAPAEFLAAFDIVQKKPDVYERIGTSSVYLMYESDSKKYVTFQPKIYYRGASMSAGGGTTLKYGDNTLQPGKKGMNVITVHTSRENALAYYQSKKTSDSPGSSQQRIWGMRYLRANEGRHYEFIRSRIVQPTTRNGDDVERIIDLADGVISNPQVFGSMRNYKEELKNALIPIYEDVVDDANRSYFLNELLQQLLSASSTVNAQSATKIAKWFQSHKNLFGIHNRRAG